MNRILFALLFAIIPTLEGCNVDVKDGRIPSEYLPSALKYLGTYQGDFDGDTGSIDLRVTDGNRPTITLSGFSDGDLLGSDCHSSFGDIFAVNVDKDSKSGKPRLNSVFFAFSPGKCWMISTDQVKLDFFEKPDGIRMWLTLDYTAGSQVELSGDFTKVSTEYIPGYFEALLKSLHPQDVCTPPGGRCASTLNCCNGSSCWDDGYCR